MHKYCNSQIRRLFLGAVCFATLLTNAYAAAPVDRVLPPRSSCDGEHVQVTLGLPASYLPPAADGITNTDDNPTSLCVSTANGNPYELLSWLENGSLRAVVLPQFAIAVLQADDASKFAHDYVEFAPSPLASLKLKRRVVQLTDADGHPASAVALNAWFATVASAASDSSPIIVLPHHLSLAVPELFMRAAHWMDERGLATEAREKFMASVVAAIRFQVIRGVATPQALTFVERTDDVTLGHDDIQRQETPLQIATSDRLIVRRQLLANLSFLRGAIQIPRQKSMTTSAALFAVSLNAEQNLGSAVKQFRIDNYQHHTDGALSHRYFRFLLPELWSVLQARDFQNAIDWPTAGGMALVLTGGGVKASYQTRLIDALYSNDARAGVRLSNDAIVSTNSGPAAEPMPQRVDFVIGTSGGALLGMFVGALNESISKMKNWSSLTDLLWHPDGHELKSTQVFPALDMMRYFSVLVCFWILWLTMALTVKWFGERWWRHIRSGSAQHNVVVAERTDQEIVRWKTESWPWISLLAIAPIIVVQICDKKGLEHVPPIAGLFYAAMAVIAWYSDVSLTPVRRFSWKNARVPKTFSALLVVGLACIAIPTSGELPPPQPCTPMPWQIDLCFTGFILLAAACHAFFAHQRDYFKHEPWRQATGMLAGVLGMVLLSYVVVWIGVELGYTAFLELTGGFWLWLLPSMLALSIVLMFLGRVTEGQTSRTPAQRALGYLYGEHNSRAFWTGHRRYTRLVIIATLSWSWWNLLAAPALYGNCTAQTYFNNTYTAFTRAVATPVSATSERRADASTISANCPPGNSVNADVSEISLTVPYVVTATSLQKSQERYFLFLRNGHSSALSDRAWLDIASDGRWMTVHNYVGCDLRAAAFASGSPFPVFSSHQVALASLHTDEQLIDGGFAHNKPLDAARVLGAGKVLVLNSSPLEDAGVAGDCSVTTLFKWGELACNVPKLLPYLWSRSQVEDSLSSEQMLVASIYPTGDGRAWPMLTDFRGATVERMIAAADHDLHTRVGTIESWGTPQLGNAYSLPLNVTAVHKALAE